MVSNTSVAAEAGTAKLRSADSSSVMNAKNETAMNMIARIRNFFTRQRRQHPPDAARMKVLDLAVPLHFEALQQIAHHRASHDQREQ